MNLLSGLHRAAETLLILFAAMRPDEQDVLPEYGCVCTCIHPEKHHDLPRSSGNR